MDEFEKALDHVKDVLQKDAVLFDRNEWKRIQQGLMFKDSKFMDQMVYKNINTGEIKYAYHDVPWMNKVYGENSED